jgi:hypothetical protein
MLPHPTGAIPAPQSGRAYTPPRVKARPVRDPAFRRAWALLQAECCFCGQQRAYMPWPGPACHHLIRRGRSDEATNLALLCGRCHEFCHGARVRVEGELLPGLSLGMQLACKRLADPSGYDPVRLAVLRGRCLPEEEALPEWLQAQRQRRGLPC